MTPEMLIYGVSAGLLALSGAWALATVFRMAGHSERWVWFGALGVTVALSLAPLWARARIPEVTAGVYRAVAVKETSGMAESIPWFFAAWGVASALIIALAIIAEIRHRRRTGTLRATRMRGLSIWMSDEEGPAICGALRPRLVLPERIAELSTRERTMVLLHEAEHLRAGDPQLNGLALALTALVPWNPWVWVLRSQLLSAIERDCDQRALRRRRIRPSEYVGVLLAVASWGLAPPRAPMRLSMGRSARELKTRIERVLQPSPPRAAGAVAGLMLLAVGGLAPLLADPPRPTTPIPPIGGVIRPIPSDTVISTFTAVEVPAARATITEDAVPQDSSVTELESR